MSANFTPGKFVQPRTPFEREHCPNGLFAQVEGARTINVSNSNAREILAALGLDPHFEEARPETLETIEAESATFLRIASGSEVDAAVPARVDGNWIDCGRRENYLTQRIGQLRELVQAGLTAGATHLLVG